MDIDVVRNIKMEEYLKVFQRKTDGWKYVTIPKSSNISEGDIVIVRSIKETK